MNRHVGKAVREATRPDRPGAASERLRARAAGEQANAEMMAKFAPLTADNALAAVTWQDARIKEILSVPVKHVRAAGAMRADRRFRNGIGTGLNNSRAIDNRHGTICGADPTPDDHDRATAMHLIKSVAVAPSQLAHWVADMCPACRGAL